MDVVADKVIATVSNKEPALRLMKHKRNSHIINTRSCYYYQDQSGKYQTLTGLLPRLRKTFYPDTDFYKQRQKHVASNGGSGTRSSGGGGGGKRKREVNYHEMERKRTTTKGGRYGGKIIGTETHREIEDFIFMDQKNFLKRHPEIHPHTRKILSFVIDQMQWSPLCCEFDVYDVGLRIGTSIDLVCLESCGRLVLCEIKTGYRDYFDNSDGHMHGSLSHLNNSPHSQAVLQLISAAMFVVKNHSIPISDMLLCVLRVDDANLDCYTVNNAYAEKIMQNLYNDLLNAI